MKRHRIKHSIPLEERLLQEAEEARKQAERLPPGEDRDVLLEDRDLLFKESARSRLNRRVADLAGVAAVKLIEDTHGDFRESLHRRDDRWICRPD
jgi:hypothetical protein